MSAGTVPSLNFEMAVLWVLDSLLCLAVLWAFGVWGHVLPPEAGFIAPAGNPALWLVGVLSLGAAVIGLYRSDTCADVWRLGVMLAVVLVTVAPLALAMSTYVFQPLEHLHPRAVGLLQVGLTWACCVAATHLAFGLALRGNVFLRRVALLGTKAVAPERLSAAHRCAYVDLPGEMDTLSLERMRQDRIWGVVVDRAALGEEDAARLVKARSEGVRVYDWSDFLEEQLGCVDLGSLGPDWLAFRGGLRHGAADRAGRWLLGMGATVALLTITLPLMLITALAIALESPGGVFYRQERVGLGGKPYMLLKFRSMRADSEANGPVWAQQNDPRVTRVGRFIRRVRIDELPQLLNVLRGDMAFVGPRPERPRFVRELERQVPRYADRAWVKPGITGWAQVNYPYGASVEDARRKLSYDLYYVKHRSWLLDLRIIAATVRVVLFSEGAR